MQLTALSASAFSNFRLSLELPVVFPLERAIPPNLPESEWPNATTTKALKFKSNDGTPLTVQGKVSLKLKHTKKKEKNLTRICFF